ncbi:hypothetical protein [Bacillus sp. S10(2024)]|uniref:hypothetical protein n=1 Tax=Bacillus sp. S10(2024) TaxID=3162886 RepID=UPI003D222799
MKKVLLTTIGCTFVVSITAGFIGFNKGDTGGAPQRPDLAYAHGKIWFPADNRGDGGMVSNKAVKDPGGHIVSNEADGNTAIIAQA